MSNGSEFSADSGASMLRTLVGLLPGAMLEQALTHASWVTERAGSYERMEFLGDSVLGLAIASALYDRFPESDEGGLARIKAFVVSRRSCETVAARLDLAGLIVERAPAAPERRAELAASRSSGGNILEALIGAAYVRFGFERTRDAVTEAFQEQIEYAATQYVDHKTELQEFLASRGSPAVYRLACEEGPPHARVFTSEVAVGGTVKGRGTGKTIKMSEQAAAREALSALGLLKDETSCAQSLPPEES